MSIQKDLLVVAADLDAENALIGILSRHHSLGTFPLRLGENATILRLQGDSNCYIQGVDYLRRFCTQYQHALLMFDLHGSGRDGDDPAVIENDLDQDLARNGWEADRARAIVIDRELEAWVWSQSPHVATSLSRSSPQALAIWLKQEKWLAEGQSKPPLPKEALHAAYGKQPRAPFFQELAKKVKFKDCQDRSFNRLLTTLRTWFPATPPEGSS